MSDIFFSQRFSPEIGGSIVWLNEICRHWPKEYLILCHQYTPELTEDRTQQLLPTNCKKILRADLLMSDWSIRNFSSLRKYWRAFRLICQEQNESTRIIHANHIVPEGLTAIFTKLAHPVSKVVCYVHGEEILAYKTSQELRLLARLTVFFCDLLICNSENTKKLLLETFPKIPAKKITVIHPSIDYDSFQISTSKESIRQQYNIAAKAKVLITVGRLTKRKNQAAVLTALQELKTNFKNITYLIIGSGPEETKLKSLAAELELEQQVLFFTDPAEEVKIDLLKAADLFVMPGIKVDSDIEGFGIAFLEAAASGLPAIAGQSGGEAEAVINNSTGVIIDGSSKSDLNKAITTLLTDTQKYAELSSAALERAKKFDSKLQTIKIFKLCQKLYEN